MSVKAPLFRLVLLALLVTASSSVSSGESREACQGEQVADYPFPGTAREVQPLNGRPVLGSR